MMLTLLNVAQDAPERTAAALLLFWERNDRTRDVLKGVKKVGEI